MWRRAKPWRETLFWSLDLETTGLDVRRDEILSVGMVPIRQGAIRWGERYYTEVRPPGDAGSDAVPIHQILPDQLDTAPPLEEVLPGVLEKLEGSTLVVHYAQLDVTMLERACRDLGLRWPKPPVVDTMDLIASYDRRRRLIEPESSVRRKPTPYQLGMIREFLDLPPHDEHHALHDALATAELLLVLRARLDLERLG